MDGMETIYNDHWLWIYNFSLKILLDPHEAEDASQEIFEKILKGYPRFRGECQLRTWIFRIAKNHLMSQKSRSDAITWEQFESDLHEYAPYQGELGLNGVEEKMYIEEIKVGCTTAMLQCLDREDRIVFVLATILQFPGREGALICGLTEANYRKILSRARTKLGNFLSKNCGLISESADCRCRKRISHAVQAGRLNPEKLLYQTGDQKIRNALEELNLLDALSEVYLDHPLIQSMAAPNPNWNFLK